MTSPFFRFFRRLRLALSYVTCLGQIAPWQTQEELSGLSKYLPLVGLIIGSLLVLLCLLLKSVNANQLFSAAVITIAWLLLTNGLHFDGLMDTADGIFSHQSPERTLEIMTDSRAGNFAVLTGVSVLLLKFVSLAALSPSSLITVLLFVPAWARWCETYVIASFPYLKEQGKGKIWHDTTRCPQDIYRAALAPMIVLGGAIALGFWPAALFSGLTALCGVTTAHWLNNKLGGQTGDTYGSVVELAEAGALICIALISALPGYR